MTAIETTSASDLTAGPTLLGHPAGLFTLFFAEMWERFCFYGMRAILVLYMVKGFLGYGDDRSIAVYGAYTALVYMTPFFGGLLADNLLGKRRAVVVGGLFMAAGEMLLTLPSSMLFYTGLALLICGNGFFKPNIATIVGTLYPPASARRDGGFTIFYMGVNLGAAMSPLLCGYLGETWGWHWGFGLAAIGMLLGLAVFVSSNRVAQVLILLGVAAAAAGLAIFRPDNVYSMGANLFVATALVIAGIVACFALARGGLPAGAGAPRDPRRLHARWLGPLTAEIAVYLATIPAVALFILLVSAFSPLTAGNQPLALIPAGVIASMQASSNAVIQALATVFKEMSTPAGMVLVLSGLLAFGYVAWETLRMEKVARERMYVVLILTFFSMLFWAFFEQAGSSVNNFTDRNVDRVLTRRRLATADVGQTITFRVPTKAINAELAQLPHLNQEQLGYRNGNPDLPQRIAAAVRTAEKSRGKLTPTEIDRQIAELNAQPVFTMSTLMVLRDAAAIDAQQQTLAWKVLPQDVGMGVNGSEVPASAFQAANPVYILLFGLAFSALWSFLGSRGREPTTTVKFALGLLQLGLGFVAFWYATRTADARGMANMGWLLLGYLLHTTGELCLSPVGLAMVTKLSPARLVSTMMGTWYLATAFSQFLAAIIAQFTGATHGSGGGTVIPPPLETVHVYGDVFGKIALSAVIASLICFALAPILNRWMHATEA